MGVYDVTGRKALVTGAARGLGAGMAEALAAAGAAVVIGDIDTATGEQTAQALRDKGATASFVRLDVRDDASWEAAVAHTVGELGGFDILINNAGVELTKLVVDTDADELRRMLEVNVVGTALGLKHAFRAMRPGGVAGAGGAVVNISSVAATIAFPGISGYSATKSGVDRLTRVAAMEAGKLGYGVRVNCVYPGLVPTEMGAKLAADVVALGLFPSIEEAIGAVVGPHTSGSARRGGRHGRRRRLPGIRRGSIHHRSRAPRRRRDGDVMTKPVVVYGVSGYTGRLICEYLREYNVPFIAAGRDGARTQEVVDKIPGIDTVEYDVVEVAHDVDALTRLFEGASVVCNTVGPFITFGPEVVEASLAAGCHYLDTTGEQDWVLSAKSTWGQQFKEKGRLLSPALPRCTPPERSRRTSALRPRGSTPSTFSCCGRAFRRTRRLRRSSRS